MAVWPSINHDGCGHDPGYRLMVKPPQGGVIFYFTPPPTGLIRVQPSLQIKHLARHESESHLFCFFLNAVLLISFGLFYDRVDDGTLFPLIIWISASLLPRLKINIVL